jgi:hypothetical protein
VSDDGGDHAEGGEFILLGEALLELVEALLEGDEGELEAGGVEEGRTALAAGGSGGGRLRGGRGRRQAHTPETKEVGS